MSKHTIVILANSIKHGEHCVAGKDIQSKQWVRPVSNTEGAALSDKQAKFQNPYGTYLVKPMQKIEMSLVQNVPLINQPENYLIDDSTWQQRYSINDQELLQYVDNPSDLWGDGDHVIFANIENGFVKIEQSLYLVSVDSLNLYKTDEGKRRVNFMYNGIQYNLAVTDPKFDSIVSENTEVKNILCISLAEKFNNNCYKVVAHIF